MRISEYLKNIIDAVIRPIEEAIIPLEPKNNPETELYKLAAEIEHKLNEDKP